MSARRLILILGDQLCRDIAAMRGAEKARDVVVMAEVAEEAGYADHHKQKLALVFAAMRHFAEELREAGWTVDYQKLDDDDAADTLREATGRAAARHDAEQVFVTEPGEWRLSVEMDGWEEAIGLPVIRREDDRFLCSRDDFAAWAKGRKTLVMEYFYREMRRKTGLLMEDGAAAGGAWNYDAENRKPAADDLFLPEAPEGADDPITRDVLDMVEARFPGHFGKLRPFCWQVTRKGAEAARDRFLADALPRFGDYQDAMLRGRPWMYHSVLSAYLNLGLLDPLDLCRRAEAEWREGRAPLNAVEGFIRQILGWREFIRGIYWLKMPEYRDMNALGADRALPGFYWTGETDMRCLAEAIGQTIETAYAHHIQRLMITGTFALLTGADPKAVHAWYLGVYADAYEWVELPNTLGMSQYADGGIVGTKPYAASASYIDRMSDYCGGCRYDPKQKLGAEACPWNALYWDFIARHEERFAGNRRMGLIIAAWRKMDAGAQRDLRAQAGRFLDGLS